MTRRAKRATVAAVSLGVLLIAAGVIYLLVGPPDDRRAFESVRMEWNHVGANPGPDTQDRLAARCLDVSRQCPGTVGGVSALLLAAVNAPNTPSGQDATRQFAEQIETADLQLLASAFDRVSAGDTVPQFVPPLLARVRRAPDHPRCGQLLAECCAILAPQADGEPSALYQEAADLIAERYAASPDIQHFCEVLAGPAGSPPWAVRYERHLRAILDANRDRMVRCAALYALASVVMICGEDRQAEAEALFEQFCSEFDGKHPYPYQNIEELYRHEAQTRIKLLQVRAAGKKKDASLDNERGVKPAQQQGKNDKQELHGPQKPGQAAAAPKPGAEKKAVVRAQEFLNDALKEFGAAAADDCRLLADMAGLQAQLGDRDAAKKLFEKASALVESQPYAWVWLAMAVARAGDVDKAIVAALRIPAGKERDSAFRQVAKTLATNRLEKEALRIADMVEDKDTKSQVGRMVLEELALAHAAAGKIPEALRVVERMKDPSSQVTGLLGSGGLGLSWGECPRYPGVALVEAKAGNKAQAMKTLERAAKLIEAIPKMTPERVIALITLSCVQARLGEFTAARKSAEGLPTNGEQPNPSVLKTLVRQLARAGRAKEALAEIDQLSAGTTKVYALMHLGAGQAEAGDQKAARASFEQAHQLIGQLGKPGVGIDLATVRANVGDYKGAIQTAETYFPENDLGYANIASAHAYAGDFKGALEVVAKIKAGKKGPKGPTWWQLRSLRYAAECQAKRGESNAVLESIRLDSHLARAYALMGLAEGMAALLPALAAQEKPAAPQADGAGEPLPQGAVARLGSSRLRIGNAAFALTPDGRQIVTVSPQGVVRIFDAQTGRLLSRRQITDRHDTNPTGQAHVELSADGKTAVICDHQITVWDVPSGKVAFRPQPDKRRTVGRPALSPDGRWLALAELSVDGGTQTLRVYDLQTGQGKDLGGVEFNVHAMRFSADGKRLVVSQTSARAGPREDTFAYFDVAAGKQLWALPRKGQEFAFSPDGKTVVSADFRQVGYQIIETDPDSGKPAERFQECRLAHPNVELLFAPDSRTVVMNYFDLGVAKWNIRTGEETVCFKQPLQAGRGWGPELGAISADGRTLLTNLGHLQRWDLTTGKAFFEPPPDDGLGGPIEHLAFTPDGKQVIATSWAITSGRWEVATGKRVAFTPKRLGRQLITTPGGLRALRCNSRKSPTEVEVLDPFAGKLLQTVGWAAPTEVGINGLRSYALTVDGKTLLVAQGDEPVPPAKQNTYVTACDVASGRRLVRFAVAGNLYFPNSPFSPCGRWVALAGKVYHVATGKALFAPAGDAGERLISGDRVMSPVWFSNDGRLLAGRLSGKQIAMIAVWELASGTVLARFPEAGHVAQVAFAPDGRAVALLDGWGVHVHDLPTGKRLAAYPAADVLCGDTFDRGCGTQNLAFAPDGRTLATGHLDGTILLWKVPSVAVGDAKVIAASERERLWADLGMDNSAKALAAVKRLVGQPAMAAALLRSRFQPPRTAADPVLAALVKDLDSEDFATREEAMRKLKEQAAKAEPVLRRELASPASLERKRRIEDILAAIPPPPLRLPLAGDTLRGVRAIEVLERSGSTEARQLLHAWAEQTQNLQLAAEARAALRRSAP